MSAPCIEVHRTQAGLLLPGLGLALDPKGHAKAAFVSHAHSDHTGRHALTFCTRLTSQLMTVRQGKHRGDVITLDFEEPHVWHDHTLRLLPAGHIIGSAMLHLTRHSDGATLLYTGDYKLRAGLSTPPARLIEANTLIMETTFGLPRYEFPPLHELVDQLQTFTRDALEADSTPVLMGYSLGKAQEIIAAIAPLGAPVMLHSSITKLMPICAPEMGKLPAMRAFDAQEASGHIVVVPPMSKRSPALQSLPRLRTAVLTGWALQPSAKYRYGVDAAFPISDHADYPELLRTVELVQPQRIFTVHGYTREFAADLRRLGHDAWTLGEDEQLEMRL